MRAIRAVAAPESGTRAPQVVTRVWLSALSQGLSSITNLGLIVALAVSTSTEDFGRIVSVYSIYMLALAVSRALTTDVLVATAERGANGSSWRWARRRVLLTGLAGTAPALAVGLVVGTETPTLVMLTLSIPVLLYQDGIRHLAWVDNEPRLAVSADGIWLVTSVIIAGLMIGVSGAIGPSAIVAAWCFGGLASCLFGWRQIASIVPAASTSNHMFSPGLRRYRAMVGSQSMMAVAVNLGPVAVAILLSSTMAGALKAAVLPIAPLLSVFAGIRVVTLPAMRAAAQQGRIASLTFRLVTGSGSVAALGAGVSVWVVSSLPSAWVGESITLVKPYLAWSVLICVMLVCGQQLADSTALAGRHALVERRSITIILEWGFLMAGGFLFGTEGLVIGWAIGASVACAAWVAPALRP